MTNHNDAIVTVTADDIRMAWFTKPPKANGRLIDWEDYRAIMRDIIGVELPEYPGVMM